MSILHYTIYVYVYTVAVTRGSAGSVGRPGGPEGEGGGSTTGGGVSA